MVHTYAAWHRLANRLVQGRRDMELCSECQVCLSSSLAQNASRYFNSRRYAETPMETVCCSLQEVAFLLMPNLHDKPTLQARKMSVAAAWARWLLALSVSRR
jgi:hypothetical protein